MKLLEICFWDAIYWLIYLPVSVLLWAWTGQGDLLGILVIGSILTLILTAFLMTQDGLLFDDWEPAIVHTNIQPEVEVTTYGKKRRKTPTRARQLSPTICRVRAGH